VHEAIPRPVYRAGIIGCGRIADAIEDELINAPAWSLLPYSHAGAYQRCPRTRLVAAADVNRERLEAFGRRRSVDRLYGGYREMFDRENLAIVSKLLVGTGTYDPGARGIIGFPNNVRVYLNCVDDPVQFELDLVGSEGRIRVGNGLYPEVWQVDRTGPQRMLVRRGFPGVHDGRSGMLRAVEDLVRAMETGSKPASNEVDGRADLEIAVALHLSHRSGERVRFPVTAPDYVIEDPWGRDR